MFIFISIFQAARTFISRGNQRSWANTILHVLRYRLFIRYDLNVLQESIVKSQCWVSRRRGTTTIPVLISTTQHRISLISSGNQHNGSASPYTGRVFSKRCVTNTEENWKHFSEEHGGCHMQAWPSRPLLGQMVVINEWPRGNTMTPWVVWKYNDDYKIIHWRNSTRTSFRRSKYSISNYYISYLIFVIFCCILHKKVGRLPDVINLRPFWEGSDGVSKTSCKGINTCLLA